MKIAIVLLLCVVACFARLPTNDDLQKQFLAWTQQQGKSYGVDEFQYRWQIWRENALFIARHAEGNHSFHVAMNKFGDLNTKEFSKLFMGFAGHRAVPKYKVDNVVIGRPSIPASVDWRTKGAVTGVKNQGQCGSCWSFSATGSTEGAHFLQKSKALVGLSEQNLVDCSQAEGNEGCNGGLMDDAFQYIITNNGIDSEASYPYTAETGTCHFSAANVASHIVSFKDVPSGNEGALTSDIATVGPISVAIDASHSSFQFYSGGVYYEPACSSTALDHGVLAVGYGTSGSSAYYIVKNSWGSDWGMSGYIWMSRNRSNNCGIATMSSYPCATAACIPAM